MILSVSCHLTFSIAGKRRFGKRICNISSFNDNESMQNQPLNDTLESVLLALQGLDDNPELKLPHLYNALSLLHESLGTNSWVGLYVQKGDVLLLGPFQGTPACEKIAPGKGVVGVCHKQNQTIAVSDVSTFPGYICCDAKAKSEICIPLKKADGSISVLDIDLDYIHDFDEEIPLFEKVAAQINRLLP